MGRVRDPRRDQAFELWKASSGAKSLREIADELDLPVGTIRGWKAKDQWNGAQEEKRSAPKNTERSKKKAEQKKKIMKKVVASVEANEELTEKQRLFCVHYANSNNATQSYLKAYDCGYATAMREGYAHLRKPHIKAEIKRLKEIMRAEIDFDVLDLLRYCLKVVGADIGDYLSFGQREVGIMGPFGPIIDKETKEPLTKMTNYVDLIDNSRVDTSLISEIKQGKAGVSIKLADKKWAWEQLIKYFDLLPDREKRKLDQARLQIERDKVQIMRDKASGPQGTADDVTIVDDVPEEAYDESQF